MGVLKLPGFAGAVACPAGVVNFHNVDKWVVVVARIEDSRLDGLLVDDRPAEKHFVVNDAVPVPTFVRFG